MKYLFTLTLILFSLAALAQYQDISCAQWEAFHKGVDIDQLLMSKLKRENKFGGIRCQGYDYSDEGHEIATSQRSCVLKRFDHWTKAGKVKRCSGIVTKTVPVWCVRDDGTTYNYRHLTYRDRHLGNGWALDCSNPDCDNSSDLFWMKK